MRPVSPTLAPGLLAGFLFFLHALLPSSHAWPLLWPLVGGMGAVVLASRRLHFPSFWHSVQLSVRAGSLAGGVFWLFTVLALWLLSLPQLAAAAGALGAAGGPLVSGIVLLSLGAVALLAPVLATFAGAFTFLFLRHGQPA